MPAASSSAQQLQQPSLVPALPPLLLCSVKHLRCFAARAFEFLGDEAALRVERPAVVAVLALRVTFVTTHDVADGASERIAAVLPG